MILMYMNTVFLYVLSFSTVRCNCTRCSTLNDGLAKPPLGSTLRKYKVNGLWRQQLTNSGCCLRWKKRNTGMINRICCTGVASWVKRGVKCIVSDCCCETYTTKTRQALSVEIDTSKGVFMSPCIKFINLTPFNLAFNKGHAWIITRDTFACMWLYVDLTAICLCGYIYVYGHSYKNSGQLQSPIMRNTP